MSNQSTEVRGPRPTRQPYRETPQFGGMVRRMVKAYGRRVAGDGDIASLADLVALRGQVDAEIEAAAAALHEGTGGRPGYSWTEIGTVLGITRQAARQRFGA